MILSFALPAMVEKIYRGEKIHSIRTDAKQRWKVGMTIHFWTGNPRNVQKNPRQFDEGVCTGIQRIAIHHDKGPSGGLFSFVTIDGRQLNPVEINELAKNDGFDCEEDFWNYFGANFSGRLIHWTQKRY